LSKAIAFLTMGACSGKPAGGKVLLGSQAGETKAPVSDVAPVDTPAVAPTDTPADTPAGGPADTPAGGPADTPAGAPADSAPADTPAVDTSAAAPAADASASAPAIAPADASAGASAPAADPPASATDVAPANVQELAKTDVVATAAEGGTVPEDVVRAAMKAMQDKYNENDMDGAAAIYAPECVVTVNGGVDAGGPFTGKTPQECAKFLGDLRNTMGGTNINFTVTNLDGSVHQDTWTADNGTGSCKATWDLIDGAWLITADEISFTPKVVQQDVQDLEVTAQAPKSGGSCLFGC